MFHKSYDFNLSPTLSEDMRYEVLEILYPYKTVFARDVSKIKLAKGPPLRIDLYTSYKMYKRQFRLSEEDKIEMTKHKIGRKLALISCICAFDWCETGDLE